MESINIDELDEGTLVHGCEGHARVRKCVHGNKYYGYQPAPVSEEENPVEVDDMDVNYVPCCS
mgnify:CR=1 FL=1